MCLGPSRVARIRCSHSMLVSDAHAGTILKKKNISVKKFLERIKNFFARVPWNYPRVPRLGGRHILCGGVLFHPVGHRRQLSMKLPSSTRTDHIASSESQARTKVSTTVPKVDDPRSFPVCTSCCIGEESVQNAAFTKIRRTMYALMRFARAMKGLNTKNSIVIPSSGI